LTGAEIPVLLSDLFRAHGWRSNTAIADAIEADLPMMAEWVRSHPSADSVFGLLPGLAPEMDRIGVTDAQAAQVLAAIADHPWFFEPLLSVLKGLRPLPVPVDHTLTAAQLSSKLARRWPTHPTRFVDARYSVCHLLALRDAIAATGYRYGAWVEEEQDCDEWAGRLWGALQRTIPGNLAVGFVSICGESADGRPQCHALLLAYTAEGLVWIENTGQIYPVGSLPGWDNGTITIEIGVF
jgi:hypothetical protein